jgi:glucose-6-phosphate isomerase
MPSDADRSPAAEAAREAHAVLERMAAIVAAWRGEEAGSPRITDLVHVGIGGSDFGPRLVCKALAHLSDGRIRTHFVANVDGTEVDRLTKTLDPRTTAVSLVSKSFTTQETLLNATVLRRWIEAEVGADGFARRIVAVTANVPAARDFGIPEACVLPMWDWVGGRYSVWSAVGFPVALMLGVAAFREFLDGARLVDEHYASAPFGENLPVLLALAGIFNRNALAHATHAVIAYDDRLAELPGFLQQLDMESNGKRVDEFGEPLRHPAAPVIWGQVGTNAQHAFFQSLHQGVDTVPLDLVGVIEPCHALHENHRALLANLVAQSVAFMRGTGDAQRGDDALSRQKVLPGDRPHNVILLDALTPHALGTLLALYEHKVHAQGRIWGVNSFDQWGVELGKQIAKTVLPAIETGEVPDTLDPSSRALIFEILERTG